MRITQINCSDQGFPAPGILPAAAQWTNRMHPIFRLPLLATLIALVGACNPTAPEDQPASAGMPKVEEIGISGATASDEAQKAETPSSSFLAKIGAQCKNPETGQGCIIGNMEAGDYYDVELNPGCSENGVFGGVIANGPALLDTLPVTGSNARETARLSKNQLLCVQAVARAGQTPSYYHVVALNPSQIEACSHQPACSRYQAVHIELAGQSSSGNECTLDSDLRATDGCAQGWIDADSVEIPPSGP